MTPISFIQAKAFSVAAAQSATVSFDAPVKAGSTLIVGFDVFPTISGTPQITDSLGNPYTLITGPVFSPNPAHFAAFLGSSINVVGGADSVTVRMVGASVNTFVEVYAQEYSGISAFDVSKAGAGTSLLVNGITSGFATTTGTKDLIFGYCVSGTVAAGTGFTARSNFNNNLTEDLIVTGPGSYQAVATMISGAEWVMIMAAYKGF